MNSQSKKLFFYSIDFLLLNISLLIINFLKRDTFVLSPLYLKLFLIYNVSLLASNILAKKRPALLTTAFFTNLLIIIKANALLIYFVSMLIYVFGLSTFSRVQTFGTCLMFFVLETIYVAMLGFFVIKKHSVQEEKNIKDVSGINRNSYSLLFIDMLLVLVSFFIILFLKNKTLILADRYEHILLVFYTLFIPISIVTQKYDKTHFDNFDNAITPCIKTMIGMVACFSILIFALRLFYFSRIMVFGSLLVVFFFEAIVFFLYCRYREFKLEKNDIEDVEGVRKALLAEKYPVHDQDEPAELSEPVHEKLKYALEFLSPELYQFVNRYVDLDMIDKKRTSVLNTDNAFNVDTLDAQSQQLILNLHKLNDIRWFNRYFLALHTRLRKNGIFIGKAHTIATHYDYYMSKGNKHIARFLYALNFLWNRVFPKLPFTQKVYFAITGGRNRMVSRAEIFGRLYFCGFKIVAEEVIDHRLYFIAQKVKTPSANENPTYGPLIKLNRTGYNGSIIQVYKFRTMHPYSEFLQDYIYEHCDLDEGG